MRTYWISTCACCVILAPPTWAQSLPADNPTAAAPGTTASPVNDNSGFGDIIVTAQKRSETAQSVPIAITAIGGDALEKARILDTQSLQAAVPSLNYASDSGFAMPFLRGVGSTITAPGAEASVATFVDGVYVANSQSLIMNLLGVDRIEVLAGPQGTLYGRNASGGAINVYTLTPKNEFEAAASLGYGKYDALEGNARVSGGVTDRLAVGLYVAGMRRDTYLNFGANRPQGQRTANKAWGVRAKAVWDPIDAVKLTGSIEHSYDYNVEGGVRNGQPDAIGVTLGGSSDIRNYLYLEDVPQFTRTKTTAAVLREEVDLDFAQLVGITAYRHLNSFTQTNLDGTDAPVAYVNSPVRSKQFSQEVQLVSRDDSKIKWIVGGYYFHDKSGFLPLSVRSAVLLPAPLIGYDFFSPLNTRSYALFAQASVPLLDRLSLTVGGRYTWDRKVKGDSRQDFLTSAGVAQSVPTPGAAASWSKFTPKISVEYKANDTLFYATYSQGYKSGLFTVSSADNTVVNPETLKSFEVGVKSDLFDRRLRVNLAAYRYTFSNLQVSVFKGGAAQAYENAAAAKAYGLEATVAGRLTSTTTLKFGASLEQSEYTSYLNAPFFVLSPLGNGNSSVSAKGNPLIRAPKFVGTAGIDQRIPLADGSEFQLSADVYHNSGFFWDPAQQRRQPSYDLVGASLGYTRADKQWRVNAWVKNLFDKYHANVSTITNFGTYNIDAEPRTFGVTLSWQTP